MNYDFENYLFQKLTNIAVDCNFKDDNGNPDPVEIYVSKEQNFAKMEQFTPNTIYVVVKYLSSNIQFDAEITPIQILVLSEQNSLEKVRIIMNRFANENNWQMIIDGTTYIKQQYNSPVVLNNYVEVSYGYRSVLYVTGTLYIMEGVVDVTDVYVDKTSNSDKPYHPISFNINYSMSTNTQQTASKFIATSMKTVSTFSITMTVPMLESKLITKVINILKETRDTTANIDYDGNNPFVIEFTCGGVSISKTMRLVSAQIMTAPNQVPSLQLGFME